ncbi:lactate 2-monooxygenase [Allokutzneria multivorans]|uniref:Lactate 2-monooxygenase n=1 Tax=Allokutzneria multivorans TaxID=1142134 RepID=A0ABP7SDY1_9PSEU
MSLLRAANGFERIHNGIYQRGRTGEVPLLPTDLAELESMALAALQPEHAGYLNGGAGRGRTVATNRGAFDRLELTPAVLNNVAHRDHATTLCSTRMAAPVFVSPMGGLSLAHPDADTAIVRAAAERGVPTAISPMACTRVEDLARAAPDSVRWMELLWHNNDAVIDSMLARAQESGIDTLIIGVDLPTLGWRPAALDHAYLPFLHGVGATNILTDPAFLAMMNNPQDHDERARRWSELSADASRTWESLERLRARWRGPLIVKGLQRPSDARRAVNAGADAVFVSNHGGRQVDGAAATLSLLPAIVDEIDGDVPVLVDGGVRSGADVVMALALGADAVGLGRLVLWGLTVAGQDGVGHVLDCVLAEMDATIANLGVASAQDLRAADVVREYSGERSIC